MHFTFFEQNQISHSHCLVCSDFLDAFCWSVPLQNHRQIKSLEDQIHRRNNCFQVIHLVLVMVWLVVPIELLVQAYGATGFAQVIIV